MAQYIKNYQKKTLTMVKQFIIISLMAIAVAACGRHSDYDATGVFEADVVTLSAETSGRIESLVVAEGEEVTRGQLLCVIDTTMLHMQRRTLMAQQRALLAGKPDVDKQIASLKVQVRKQRDEVARVHALLSDDAATQKQMDDAIAQLSVLESQYDAVLSAASKSSASIDGNAAVVATQIEQIDETIARSRIMSNVDGTVLGLYVREGEMAVVGRPLVKIADLKHMVLRAYLTSDQLSHVAIGQKVKVVADFGASEQYEYEGTVRWIASESEFTPKNIQTRNSRANMVYAVKITVENDGRIKIGTYGEVEL